MAGLFEVEEEHVWIHDGRFLNKADTLHAIHYFGEGITEVFAFDIDDGFDILVFPVEFATDVEDVLVPFVSVGVVDGFRQLVLVDGCVPY